MTAQSTPPETYQYPSPPWALKGRALVSLHTVDMAAAREFLPAMLEVLPILPGKTLGGLYLSSYEAGSALVYNELIVFCGLVRYGDRTSAWITHIYVDNPQSVAGGREIWGLPKELASFRWMAGEYPQVTVSQDDQMLCRLKYRWQFPGIPTPIPSFLGTFSLVNSQLSWSSVGGKAKTHLLTGAEVDVPATSPFVSLSLNNPLMAFHLEDLVLQIDQPVRQN